MNPDRLRVEKTLEKMFDCIRRHEEAGAINEAITIGLHFLKMTEDEGLKPVFVPVEVIRDAKDIARIHDIRLVHALIIQQRAELIRLEAENSVLRKKIARYDETGERSVKREERRADTDWSDDQIAMLETLARQQVPWLTIAEKLREIPGAPRRSASACSQKYRKLINERRRATTDQLKKLCA